MQERREKQGNNSPYLLTPYEMANLVFKTELFLSLFLQELNHFNTC